MHLFLNIIVHTVNILGGLTDPFEFAGDYGDEASPIREQVFELVVPKEALAINPTPSQKALLIAEDRAYGPTLQELVPQELIGLLSKKQQEFTSLFSQQDYQQIIKFLDRYKECRIFFFLKKAPIFLLGLDKDLRNKNIELPILGSMTLLTGQRANDLKRDLLDAVFTQETLGLVENEAVLKKALNALDPHFLSKTLMPDANNADLEVFCRPAGQVFFYWLAQSLNLHLISGKQAFVEQVNKVKTIFARTLGDPVARAHLFKDKFIQAGSEVIFTQESDHVFIDAMKAEFIPPQNQNPQDGCFILLKKETWLPSYEIIPLADYDGYHKGKITTILATHKISQQKYLLAACHGKSTDAADGRAQISHVKKSFDNLQITIPNLQLVIGIDANTKNEEEVKALHDHLEALGLIATHLGPTTVKRRMVTLQNTKAGRMAVDTEDFIITLKSNELTEQTVGSQKMPSSTTMLPNISNPSDHYPVGATLSIKKS